MNIDNVFFVYFCEVNGNTVLTSIADKPYFGSPILFCIIIIITFEMIEIYIKMIFVKQRIWIMYNTLLK